ncbi:MAG: hypothetical protein WBC44_20565 [Planctomycetaceae bacterium]
MRRLSRYFTPALLSVGTALSAYGGYGAGVGHAVGAGLPHWLQVAALAASGLGLLGFCQWRNGRGMEPPPASFAADLTALERLVPTLRKHPDGLATLQDLIDVLFESCHRPEAVRAGTTLVERSRKGGRADG